MSKIKVKNPVVEMDGDEMTRIIWKFIKDKLILPYLEIDLKYFDLGIEHRDATRRSGHDRLGERDEAVRRRRQVRDDHARRSARQGVQASRRCGSRRTARSATSSAARSSASRSSARTCRGSCPGWTKPIVVGRHAFGDQYKATDFVVPGRRHADDDVHAEGRRQADRAQGVRLPGRRRRARHVQPRRVDHRLRAQLLQLRPQPRLAGVSVDEEHDPQEVRRPVQGSVPEGLRRRVRRQVQGRRASSTSTA